MNIRHQRLGKILAIGCVLLLQACASVKNADVRDPWEPMNRSVYNFNEALDNAAIKPVAKAYTAVLPSPVRTGIHNFVGNLGDVWTLANTALQLKLQATAETFMRITVNTVFGLGGVLDVATEMRLEKRKEDFGQTLGYWGVKPGPYVVLPVLGPSTLRDALATPLDMQGDVTQQFNDQATRHVLTVTRVLDVRSSLLESLDVIKAAALDPYSFVRDAYLQKRENDVHDGNPPARFDYSESDAP
ncbi:VacJ family lipoprotein [Limnohabitans sp.]|uniref:MlaA family lipoprotein n=1 Tax=Limnohabitans sp. TaxID=1907725 RepID=UPI002AFF1C51|nr:VacJ family lipoprotein [Limnohabitans sp.]